MASPVIFVKGIPPSSTSAPRGRVPSPKRATTANRQFSLAASQGFEPRQRSRMSSNVRAPFAAPACLRLCSPSSFRFAKDRKFHLDRRDAQSVRLAGEFNNCFQITHLLGNIGLGNAETISCLAKAHGLGDVEEASPRLPAARRNLQ